MTQITSEPQTEPVIESSSNQNSPVISKQNSKFMIVIVSIVVVILLSLGVFYFIESQKKTEIIESIDTESQETNQREVSDPSPGWKTYTNTKYNYSIDYPADWEVRESPDTKSGAAFRPSKEPNDFQYEYITINRSGRVMHEDLPNPSFEEYVKSAGSEIQNYMDLVSMKKILTDSDIVGFMATWKVAPLGSGEVNESLPRTFFEIPGDNSSTIQVDISNKEYLDVYKKMISTFKLVKTDAPLTDTNTKTYKSSKLGMSFTYLEKQNNMSTNITVSESDNKICVNYQANDTKCSAGQSVEAFQKGANETLEEAIKRLFLSGKDPNRCFVVIYEAEKNLPSFVKAEITMPKSVDMGMDIMAANTEYCAPNYAQSNGIRYFLEDKNHPTKFYFFNIGQYSILSPGGKSWQDTVTID